MSEGNDKCVYVVGSLIVVGSDDVGEFVMRWWAFQRNAIFAPGVTGMWVDPQNGMTWTEHDGGGLFLPVERERIN